MTDKIEKKNQNQEALIHKEDVKKKHKHEHEGVKENDSDSDDESSGCNISC